VIAFEKTSSAGGYVAVSEQLRHDRPGR
jgi:hypothetical protein